MSDEPEAKRGKASAITVWDVRFNAEGVEVEDVKTSFREVAKKWVFQLERGAETGYLHYQGRISLKKEKRHSEIMKLWTAWHANGLVKIPFPNYFQPTIKEESKGDAFYQQKLDTRVEGPWKDDDEVKILTRQLRTFIGYELYPWQQKVLDMVKTYDERKINVIYDTEGGLGKSVFVEWLEFKDLAFEVPPFRQMEDIMAFVMSFKIYPAYLIDMPRGMKKDKLGEFYSGIESIKNGLAYDKRYEGKKKRFDRPAVVIFTNTLPDFNLLSRDRWVVWKADKEHDIHEMDEADVEMVEVEV
jgi:hypothetical protein